MEYGPIFLEFPRKNIYDFIDEINKDKSKITNIEGDFPDSDCLDNIIKKLKTENNNIYFPYTYNFHIDKISGNCYFYEFKQLFRFNDDVMFGFEFNIPMDFIIIHSSIYGKNIIKINMNGSTTFFPKGFNLTKPRNDDVICFYPIDKSLNFHKLTLRCFMIRLENQSDFPNKKVVRRINFNGEKFAIMSSSGFGKYYDDIDNFPVYKSLYELDIFDKTKTSALVYKYIPKIEESVNFTVNKTPNDESNDILTYLCENQAHIDELYNDFKNKNKVWNFFPYNISFKGDNKKLYEIRYIGYINFNEYKDILYGFSFNSPMKYIKFYDGFDRSFKFKLNGKTEFFPEGFMINANSFSFTKSYFKFKPANKQNDFIITSYFVSPNPDIKEILNAEYLRPFSFNNKTYTINSGGGQFIMGQVIRNSNWKWENAYLGFINQ